MPPLGESIQRRRVFWLLVALVVVPTLALAGYGLAGLKDRRDALEARSRDRYLLQARTLEVELVARLAEEHRELAGLRALPDDALDAAIAARVGPPSIIAQAWRVDPDARPGPWVEAAGGLTPKAPLTFMVVRVDDATRTLGLSYLQRGRVVAWQVDPAMVDAVVLPALVGQRFPNEKATYRLVERLPPDGPAAPISVDAIREALTARLAEEPPSIELSLSSPFEHWHIEIDPVERTTSPIAPTIVVFLLLTMFVVGVVLLGQAIVQQGRLSRLQTDFVSNVSHELRTPLTSIRMFIETLQTGRVTDPDEVRACLDVIAHESERLTRKIERVLGWARMEAGRRIYALEPARPAEIVRRTLLAFRTQQIAGRTDVVVSVPEELPMVMADVEAMEEALLNLVTNARKYGGDGVHIRIEGGVDGRWVMLSVADDGPGVPATERKRIFEKFYRPDVLLSRRTEGSGLGLAIVKGIVDGHRGRVDVESEIGRGARFTVRLPRVLAPR